MTCCSSKGCVSAASVSFGRPGSTSITSDVPGVVGGSGGSIAETLWESAKIAAMAKNVATTERSHLRVRKKLTAFPSMS